MTKCECGVDLPIHLVPYGLRTHTCVCHTEYEAVNEDQNPHFNKIGKRTNPSAQLKGRIKDGGSLGLYRRGERIAWSSSWMLEAWDEEVDCHVLVAVPRLRLGQQATLELTSRTPFPVVCQEAVIRASGDLLFARTSFFVVHATFDLYRTGEPDILGFAAICVNGSLPKPQTAEVISRCAVLLKEFT